MLEPEVVEECPLFGYFPEEYKSILVVREKDVEKAEKIMGDNSCNLKIKLGAGV